MILANAGNLGFPRMGSHRELKFALEKYWNGEKDERDLLGVATNLRKEHWQLQVEAGIGFPPSNDFSLYDHVLDMAVTLGSYSSPFQLRLRSRKSEDVFSDGAWRATGFSPRNDEMVRHELSLCCSRI